jgi:hypothetical protein
MVEAIKALSEARTAMVAVHNELNVAQKRLGVRVRMDFQKPAVTESVDNVTMRQVG